MAEVSQGKLSKLTQFFLGKKTMVYKDSSTCSVEIKMCIYKLDGDIMGLIDTEGNIHNWDFIAVVKENKDGG